MAEDTTFTLELAAYGVGRRRYHDSVGHTTYVDYTLPPAGSGRRLPPVDVRAKATPKTKARREKARRKASVEARVAAFGWGA